jgi:arginine/ornithine transport system substrate-binding protein
MKCKKALGTLAMLTLVATSQLSQAADKTLRIGIEAAYPPFASKTADNQIVGFDYDIGQALCAEMKVTCEWKEVEFDGLIPSLKVRKIDAAISSVSITEDRLKSVDFSRSYYLVPAKLVSRKDNGITAIPRDLKGKRIGVQRATNFERYATDHFVPAGAELVRYGTQNEIYLDLLAGRLDASLAGSIAVEEGLLKGAGGENFHFVGPSFSEQQYFGTGAGIAIRKQDPLAGELNKALANIRANGTYDQIRKKYFAVDIWSE